MIVGTNIFDLISFLWVNEKREIEVVASKTSQRYQSRTTRVVKTEFRRRDVRHMDVSHRLSTLENTELMKDLHEKTFHGIFLQIDLSLSFIRAIASGNFLWAVAQMRSRK